MEENENRTPTDEQLKKPVEEQDLLFFGEQSQPAFQMSAEQPSLKKVNFFKRDLGLSSITGGLTYSLAVLLYLGLSFLLLFVILLAKIDTSGDAFFYVSSLFSPLAIGITLIIIMATRKVKFKEFFRINTQAKYFLMAVLLTFGLLFIGAIISEIFITVLEAFGYTPSESTLPDVSGVKIIPAIIFMAIMPAFFEELLFRGLILHSAEQSMGSVRAILVTGFCFALMHGSPQQTVHQFILGCMLGLLTVRSGSLLPAMLTHFLNNLIAVILLAFSDSLGLEITTEVVTSLEILGGMLIYAAIGAAIGVVAWLITDKRKPLLECKGGGVKTFFSGASVGIAIMGIMWLLDLLSII